VRDSYKKAVCGFQFRTHWDEMLRFFLPSKICKGRAGGGAAIEVTHLEKESIECPPSADAKDEPTWREALTGLQPLRKSSTGRVGHLWVFVRVTRRRCPTLAYAARVGLSDLHPCVSLPSHSLSSLGNGRPSRAIAIPNCLAVLKLPVLSCRTNRCSRHWGQP
jgi:hypothetical protein